MNVIDTLIIAIENVWGLARDVIEHLPEKDAERSIVKALKGDMVWVEGIV